MILPFRFKDNHQEAPWNHPGTKQSKADCNKMNFHRKFSWINAVLFGWRRESLQNCLGLEIRALKPNEEVC